MSFYELMATLDTEQINYVLCNMYVHDVYKHDPPTLYDTIQINTKS